MRDASVKYLAGGIDSSLPPQAHHYLKFIYSKSHIQIYRSRISRRCAHHLFFLFLVTQVFTIPSLSLYNTHHTLCTGQLQRVLGDGQGDLCQ